MRMTGYLQCCEQPLWCYPEAVHSMILSFADAEVAEYRSQQIIGSELAGDRV